MTDQLILAPHSPRLISLTLPSLDGRGGQSLLKRILPVSNTCSDLSYDTHLISCTISSRHAQSTTNATPKPAVNQSYRPVQSRLARPYDSLTYQNRRIKQKKNPTQTFQPTPVFFAMRSIRFIVPRKRFLVPSN
jgi:hypothetical protein